MSLTVTVLSYSDEFYTTRRLLEVGSRMGHSMSVLNPFGLAVGAGPDGITFHDDDRVIEPPDVIIPRVGSVLTDWNLFIIESFVRAGACSASSASALALAADKARTSTALAQSGVATVPTIIVREKESIAVALTRFSGQPLVLKLPRGTHGRAVVGVRTEQEAYDRIARWVAQGQPVLVQPWISMPLPRDLRVMVIDGFAVGAAWRYAKRGDFRSNLHQGGHAESALLTPEAQTIAEQATEAIGLTCGAVDLIETAKGMAVLEVNGCPGFRSIEETSQLDVAELWLKAAIGDLSDVK